MQRPPFGNQGFPGGMPMHPGAPGGPMYNNPGGPQYAPGYGQQPSGPRISPQPNMQGNAGCFMPAAAIRKISNTTPPQRFNPSFE
ncbi:unnamed protein product [Arctia plantaginis]|uniref:Uncharacterized protein n=2 Tax=Arctia plantaginis TaxID=874455 RepID=A0A8S0ZN24_ARCPL|nr:unnamed protein product [Arctia plantaginis]